MSGLHLFEFSCEVSCRRGGEGDFLSITSRMYELCRNLDGGEPPHKSEMLERVGNAERFDDCRSERGRGRWRRREGQVGLSSQPYTFPYA